MPSDAIVRSPSTSEPDGVISAYLALTRGHDFSEGVRTEQVALYKFAYDYGWRQLRALTGSQLNVPQLRTVYTSKAHAEAVSIGEHTYIVYDQYLGQIINRLSRLFFEDADPREVDAYLFKLFALRSLTQGQYQSASDLRKRGSESS